MLAVFMTEVIMKLRCFASFLPTRPARVAPLLLVAWLAPSGPAPAAVAAAPDIRRDAVVNAVEMVIPSVVNIATETIIQRHDWYENLLRNFYGWPGVLPRQQKSISLGSGVIIDEDGYILTNYHVVSRANRVQIKLWDGREFEARRIVATPGSDVALLKVDLPPGEKLRAIKLAPDDDLLLGETVLALGNPFGLGSSVTKGILSSKNRRPSTGNEPLNVEDWLQTDAAINPGNSGGPLVNLRGELIGLNVAVYREEDGQRGMGVGFSIPVKQVAAAISRFFTPEVTDSLWFGALLRPGSDPLLVTAVQPSSPAAKAGIQENDRIVRINGQAPRSLTAFNRALVDSPKKTARLALQRGNDLREVVVRLQPFDELVRQKTGLTLLEPSAETAQRFGLNTGDGLFIEAVEAGSPAGAARLERGFLLTGIEGQPARELRIVGEVLATRKSGDTITLTVIVPRRLGGSYVEFRQGTVELRVR